jgi:hypothetical protein
MAYAYLYVGDEVEPPQAHTRAAAVPTTATAISFIDITSHWTTPVGQVIDGAVRGTRSRMGDVVDAQQGAAWRTARVAPPPLGRRRIALRVMRQNPRHE